MTRKNITLGKYTLFSWGEIESESKIKIDMKHFLNAFKEANRTQGLTLENKRKIALKDPYFMKAAHKKNKDTVRNWFLLKSIDGKEVPIRVDRLVKNFELSSNLPYKLYTAGVCANIYGTGFLEVIYDEPSNKTIESPVDENSKPIGIIVHNPEFIAEKTRNPNKPTDKRLYYIYEENPGEKIYLHPDRIIPVMVDKLPFSHFGVSKVDLLYNILTSKIGSDISSGEIMKWNSHGILDMTISQMNEEELKTMLEVFKQHPDYYVHSDRYKLEVKNPEQINPESFFKYFERNIAAAFEMPVHILTGESLGNVTGSEIGISDYYHDIENIQNVIYAPIIRELYKRLLRSNGFSWHYDIDWNPIFVDELSEAKIAQIRTFAATQNKNASIIDVKEARQILNEGVVDLDVNKIPKQEKPTMPPPSNPNVEPQPVVKEPTTKNVYIPFTPTIFPLNDEQKKMIQKRIEEERRLGEEVLNEQEKLFPKTKVENGRKNRTSNKGKK